MKRKAHDSVDIDDTFDEEATSQYNGGLLNEPLFNFNFAPVGPRRSRIKCVRARTISC